MWKIEDTPDYLQKGLPVVKLSKKSVIVLGFRGLS